MTDAPPIPRGVVPSILFWIEPVKNVTDSEYRFHVLAHLSENKKLLITQSLRSFSSYVLLREQTVDIALWNEWTVRSLFPQSDKSVPSLIIAPSVGGKGTHTHNKTDVGSRSCQHFYGFRVSLNASNRNRFSLSRKQKAVAFGKWKHAKKCNRTLQNLAPITVLKLHHKVPLHFDSVSMFVVRSEKVNRISLFTNVNR